MISGLTVSIVIYKPNLDVLRESLDTLLESFFFQTSKGSERLEFHLDLIDNSPQRVEGAVNILELLRSKAELQKTKLNCRYLHFPENPGYGAANNRSILESKTKFHLVLNPDIKMIPETIELCVRYLNENPGCDAVVPAVLDWESFRKAPNFKELQFLVKSYPTVFVLFLRSFAPGFLRRIFSDSLDSYDLKEKDWSLTQRSVPLVSGCFIFAKTDSLQKINGFDESFFLYFEDFDLSMRLNRKDYFPDVRIYHKGGNSSKKGFLHIRLFVTSAFRFFQKFGWKWL
ncbi:glycosyltransferase family 2 protein [Leptospira sp. 201903070]|uniref:Glycosyltransferase family 2 protein n=1 Tax=Leptospira ainlahdjerensis TaxID=2810033 RepID=A0ABS2UA68_9LEPT|nr:glycosyltransferase family 2 protein [Leptospira ainlahdjerensis]MBM9577267.1 glycosyltransferase family 2 protein [Leptospira ainlahdjerensis]